MRAIWKYPLHLGVNHLSMPQHARIVSIDQQPGIGPCAWAIVDPEMPPTERTFEVVGTGHPFNADWIYVGSWQNPPFVWHLLEATP